MLRRGSLVFCLLLCSMTIELATVTADPSPADGLNAALSTWKAGDLPGARDQLSALIASGTQDARLYYFRGLLDEQLGGSGDADFQLGARVESAASMSRQVNAALENTQGELRRRIEKFRSAERSKAKSDPVAAQRNLRYREALTARAAGDLQTALQILTELAADGADPRYFYMKGVVLAETGATDDAKAAFRDGLNHERTSIDVQRVNEALAGVQGEIRRLIEAETSIPSGETVITRQDKRQLIRLMEAQSEDVLVAESSAAEAAETARAAAEAEARRLAAAQEIAAKNREMAEQAERLAARAEQKTEDEPGSRSPLPDAPAVVPTTPTAEAPLVAEAETSANPFVTGDAGSVGVRSGAASSGAVSSVSAGPIDFSWLPENTEFLLYARPADLLSSSFVKPLSATPQFQQELAKVSDAFGLDPAEIDSVTIGVGNVMATMLPVMMQAQGGGGAPPDPNALIRKLLASEHAIAVVRTVSDADAAAKIAKGEGVETTHEGRTFHLFKPQNSEMPPLAIFAADPRTLLFASEPAIRSALTQGPGTAERVQFGFASRSSHYVQAISTPLLAGMSAGLSAKAPPGVPPMVTALLEAIEGRIEGGGMAIEAGSDLNLSIVLNLSDTEAAGAAGPPLEQLLMMGQQMFPLVQGNVPAPLQADVGAVVSSLKSASSGTAVSVSLSIPGNLVTTIMQHPELMMPQMGPGGAPPGFGPPGGAVPPGLSVDPSFSPPGAPPGEQALPGGNAAEAAPSQN